MNATLCKPESLAHDPFHETSETPAPQDLFATAPVKAMWREFDWPSAEEAYTSFEAAISDRVLALKERHISTRGNTPPALNRFVSMVANAWRKLSSRNMLVRGRPQGSPPHVHSTPAPTMNGAGQPFLRHSRGGGWVVWGGDPCGRPRPFLSACTPDYSKSTGERIWQRRLVLAGMALVLMLAGFDLMGVLVLYAR